MSKNSSLPGVLPPTVEWRGGRVRLLDQSRLPDRLAFIESDDPAVLADAIRGMQVRGAPAIGITAAYALALAARGAGNDLISAQSAVQEAAALLRVTRPTAINLGWAVERCLAVSAAARSVSELRDTLLHEAQSIHQADIAANRRIGALGAALLPDEGGVLTHCNAGALATGGYGTALGLLRAARERGKRHTIYVGETRPQLQGARLTTWELLVDGFDVTLITDSMAACQMAAGNIAAVVVGADRIAANGDIANKVGTYGLAILARHHALPLIVAAPWSSVDMATADGAKIPIEERDASEVRWVGTTAVAPDAVRVANPAFDVTPNDLVSAIVTERGVHRAPYSAALADAAAKEPVRA